MDPLPLLERPRGDASAAPGFGGIGSDVWVMTPRRRAAHEPHPRARVPRQLPRLLVARRPLHRLDRAQLERGRGRQRPLRRPRRALRPRRPAARAWWTSTWCARATGTGTRPSGGRPTARASSTPRPSTRRSIPSCSSAGCRMRGRGACRPQRLTTDPAWDEQAIFTRDMDRILFMSSRDLPGAHNDWAQVAHLLDLPADYDYALILHGVQRQLPAARLPAGDRPLRDAAATGTRQHTRFKPGPAPPPDALRR